MNVYAQLLTSRWQAKPTMRVIKTNDPQLVDQEEGNVLYPINEVTRNRDATIVRAMDVNTPDIVREQLLNTIEKLPDDPDLSKLSDEDKLTLMRSRYCQSRPELNDYGRYLEGVVDEGRISKDAVEQVAQPEVDTSQSDTETKSD